MFDSMRGWTQEDAQYLRPNTSDAEGSVKTDIVGQDSLELNSTGFTMKSQYNPVNQSGGNYIYMAIRRGTKVPESATEVFAVSTANRNTTINVGFPLDAWIGLNRDSTTPNMTSARLTNTWLETNSSVAEDAGVASWWTGQDSFLQNYFGDINRIEYLFKRAPGFFDVVAYTGDGTAGHTVSHNLTVAPEMMWIKKRSGSYEWIVYSPAGDGYLRLNTTEVYATSNVLWNATSPTSTEFTLGGYTHVNGSGEDYIAYLFASLPGISKVGSFTHSNGSNTTVDCGFTSGARFVLVKQTDLADGWFVFDTERGITVSDSPRLFLNSTASEFGASYIEPVSSGFIIKNNFWSAGDYIFYAIA
jgi:hypothetical protein